VELLAALPGAALAVRYVWLPMLPGDTFEAAAAVATRLREPRAKHYWDGDRRLGRRLGDALSIPPEAQGGGIAWDVYLLYGRGAKDIAAPGFWMHQLALTQAPRLDAEEFRRRVVELL